MLSKKYTVKLLKPVFIIFLLSCHFLTAQKNDSPEELYEWRNGITKTTNKGTWVNTYTKARPGYVILNSGEKVRGTLQLKKVNDVIENFIVENKTHGKKIFVSDSVSHYGITPIISDITNDGTKIFDEDGRNFYKGWLITKDNIRLDGYVAFVESKKDNKRNLVWYDKVYFSEDEKGELKLFYSDEIKELVQLKYSKEIMYIRYNKGFINSAEINRVKTEEQFNFYKKGSVTVTKNSVLHGEIAQVMGDTSTFCKAILFKAESGIESKFNSNEIEAFNQEVNGKKYFFKSTELGFIPLMFSGNVYDLYKNPKPSSVNTKATKITQVSSLLVSLLISTALLSDIDVAKKETSLQEQNKNAMKLELANSVNEIGSSIYENTVIYYEEYILYNKLNNENTIILEKDFEKRMGAILKSCHAYSKLSKEQKNNLANIDAITESLEWLEKCTSFQ